ncbi:MAG TPA: tripartite tricarboxylate transporter substrate-binding protein [Propionibacteriaceae bacterium]|nr:tripartite tricarboxylate transporter substrate-binding protein [Propionibacteriaceae bacterium]
MPRPSTIRAASSRSSSGSPPAGRRIAEKLSEKFGQRVIVENRVGANGLIGTFAVANAAPDGYTLVMGGVNTHGMYDVLVKAVGKIIGTPVQDYYAVPVFEGIETSPTADALKHLGYSCRSMPISRGPEHSILMAPLTASEPSQACDCPRLPEVRSLIMTDPDCSQEACFGCGRVPVCGAFECLPL